MLRFRRYRVFVICAFFVLFLLYHVSRNSQWDGVQPTVYDKVDRPQFKPKYAQDHTDTNHNNAGGESQRPPSSEHHHEAEAIEDLPPKKEQEIKIPQLKSTSEVKGGYGLPKVAATAAPARTSAATLAQATADSIPAIQLPDRVDESKDQDAPIRVWKPPKKVENLNTAAAAIHWKKPKEWFPLPKESIIPLPTGSPKPMPAIQYKFKEETKAQKEKREARLAKVRSEALRAWSGYKQFAWTHDELTPVTKHGKDPFCGWAATLVDSLDTLWIMGLKDEFDDAVQAVKAIDFTTTPYRSDIPIFETIIRYLGGLLGAYDVTGGHKGKYRVLLDKALELADVLMSVFDTPNRMPILYYNWQPEFNENPKRASTSVSVAEIGSMGMEFTRLAQLTGEDKYYDAIARITNALEELQNRKGGTALPGLFPQQLDASGCNRSAAAEATFHQKSEAAQMQMKNIDDDSDEPEGHAASRFGSTLNSGSKSSSARDLEFEVKPGSRPSEPATGSFHDTSKRKSGSTVEERSGDATDVVSELQERDTLSERAPVSANGLPAGWDCAPQGLVSGSWGMDSYSMGGSQDSAYEYFPKLYALLGGLEPKYRTMHEKTVAAVKKYLLFRPMAQGDPDILFSAKASSSDNTDKNLRYEWEITHLTCFLGGMFGLGGKLFNSEEDIEIGKKLADGCVWAYDVMPTGIMPEFAMALPCKKADDCSWNQTAWYVHLDPELEWRKAQLEEYNVKKAKWHEEVQLLKVEESRRQKVESAASSEKAAAHHDHDHHSQRGLAEEGDADRLIEDKVEKLESELDLNSEGGHKSRNNEFIQKPVGEIFYPQEPLKPLTHEEFVQQRVKTERLVPGFASLNDRRYILR